jgi:hypothetical protein
MYKSKIQERSDAWDVVEEQTTARSLVVARIYSAFRGRSPLHLHDAMVGRSGQVGRSAKSFPRRDMPRDYDGLRLTASLHAKLSCWFVHRDAR